MAEPERDPTSFDTIPMSMRFRPVPDRTGLAELGVRAVGVGVHQPGARRRHVSRTLDLHELIVVGEGRLRIAEGDRTSELKAGEWIVLRAGIPHRGVGEIDPDTWFQWLCFTTESPIEGRQLGLVRDPVEFRWMFERLLSEHERARTSRQSADAWTVLLLHQLGPGSDGVAHSAQRLRAAVDEQIDRQYDRSSCSVSTIAAELGYHPDHVGRTYRSVAGVSVTTMIHRRRITDACLRLRSGDESIAVIAAACGFDNESWFRRLFRRVVGTTPSGYRQVYSSSVLVEPGGRDYLD